jgi:phospholipid/cholesterol/gamma-HCH transport system permease protein
MRRRAAGPANEKGQDPLRFLEFLGSMLLATLTAVGEAVEDVGRGIGLLVGSILWLFRRPFRFVEILKQLDFIGVKSLELIAITGLFTGMVLTLQARIGLGRYGAESLVGAGVALSLARELGPVLTALMVIGRAGSSITAEIGTMRNSQQIDALASMGVDPVQYLVMPRVLAATLMLPLLTIIFEFFGMVGAYFTFSIHLGSDGATFMASVREYLSLDDITHGLAKSVVFGLVFSLVSCTKGFYSKGGATGVGISTTRAVVVSSLLILASDYLMTAIMFGPSS